MTLLQRDREKFEEGKAEGKAEGIAEGFAEGKLEGIAEVLIGLVVDGLLDIDIAAKRLNKSPEELQELIKKKDK